MNARAALFVGVFVWLGLAAMAGQGCGGGSGSDAGDYGPDGAGATQSDAPLGQGLGGSGGGACGEPGTPCCTATGCNGGACCVSGICMAPGGSCVGLGGGICNAGVCGVCGGAGLPCCGASGSCTAPATVCSNGICSKCGETGLACCPGASGTGICTGANAACTNGACTACGVPGSPCCPGSKCQGGGCCYNGACVAEAAACGTSAGTCQAGRCSGCGAASQPCCTSTCFDGLMCSAGMCAPCGGVGQACCSGGTGATACQAGMVCTSTKSDGVCARCGSLGDICCGGNACSEGCCSAGRCISGSCSGPDASPGTGGSPGLGGVIGSGGVPGTGGIPGTGGLVYGTGGVKGTGGAPGTGGIRGTGGSAGGCGTVIDNMESGTGSICQGNGRMGLWYTYVDTSTTSAITPATTGGAVPTYLSSPRGTSYYAMHIQGRYSTYAGLACWLNKAAFGGTTGTYNASGYSGLHFWAKGSGGGGQFNVVGQMASTESKTYGGTCTATTCAGDLYPLTGLSSTTWKEYTVPFSYLIGGTVTPFDPTSTWSFEFQFYSKTSLLGAAFDLWIDDLGFVN